MQPADSSHIGQRPRFPALDPEPPPHPWRRAGATLIVLVLAALGSWLGYNLSGAAPRPHHRATVSVSFLRGLSGVVLDETPGSYLSETDMQTGKAVVFKNLGQFSSNPDPAVSADGKYLLDAAVGRLLSLSSLGHPQAVQNQLSFVPGDMPGFMADPWSDRDTGVVELTYPVGSQDIQSTIAVAAVTSVRSGRALSLGSADSAAGDPRQAGAFIAVPKPGRPLPDGNQPDARVVLADVGERTRVLATAAQLSHVLGIKKGTALSLVPIPNSQGSKVAVQVSTITGNASGTMIESAGGIVVLSRSGAVLGSAPGGGGGLGWTGWSHSGNTLAFVGYGSSHPELIEWTIGARSATTTLRDSSPQGPTACAWSPDDTAVICDGGPRGNWLVIRSGTESVAAGQGQPLMWVNGRLGG
jgi:hypothetical protein